jgi:FkbM family methyltransferase
MDKGNTELPRTGIGPPGEDSRLQSHPGKPPFGTREWVIGKFYALRALAEMMRWFDNWRAVFDGYRGLAPLPPLRFRSGFVLGHRPCDAPIPTCWEVFRDRSYRRFVHESSAGVMIDLGANIGVVTLDWATRLKGVKIHAYEPHPATFAILAANVSENHLAECVRIYNEAVGRAPGTLVLRTFWCSVLTSAYAEAEEAGGNEESSSVRVPAVSLDQVIARCAGQGPVNLVKMDVEGAEADILEGTARSTLKEIRQFVIEYHDNLCVQARARCERVLVAAGFHCRARHLFDHQGLLYAIRE